MLFVMLAYLIGSVISAIVGAIFNEFAGEIITDAAIFTACLGTIALAFWKWRYEAFNNILNWLYQKG